MRQSRFDAILASQPSGAPSYYGVRIANPQRGRRWYAEYLGEYPARVITVHDNGEIWIGGRDVRLYDHPLHHEGKNLLSPFAILRDEFEKIWRQHSGKHVDLSTAATPKAAPIRRYLGIRGELHMSCGRRWHYQEFVHEQMTQHVIIYRSGKVEVSGRDFPHEPEPLYKPKFNPPDKFEVTCEEFEFIWDRYADKDRTDPKLFGLVGVPRFRYLKDDQPDRVRYLECEGSWVSRLLVLQNDGMVKVAGREIGITDQPIFPIIDSRKEISRQQFQDLWEKHANDPQNRIAPDSLPDPI